MAGPELKNKSSDGRQRTTQTAMKNAGLKQLFFR